MSSDSRRGRRSASGRRRGALAAWLTLAMLAVLLLPASTPAEEGDEGVATLQALDYLDPIVDSLGGSSWMMAQGFDPRSWAMPPERNPVTGWDWSMSGGAPSSGGTGSGLNQQVPFRNPAPAFSRNLIVTRQVGLFPIQTEPHVAVDPLDPEHLVLGTIDYNFPSISTYVSFDGGETWEGPNQIRYFREDFSGAGDPVVAFDRDGNVYVTAISIGVEEFLIGNIASGAQVSSMVVSKSTDGGVTWNDPVSAARSTITTISQLDAEGKERGTLTLGFLDKPWLAVGPNPDDPNIDSVYMSYTDFQTTYGLLYSDEVPYLSSPYTETTIRVVRSDDGGVTWTEPVAVSPTVLQAEGTTTPGGGGSEAGDAYGAVSGASVATPAAQAEGVITQNDEGEDVQQPQEVEGGLESNRTVQGSQPKVLADGTLVVAYVDTTNDGIQEGLMAIVVVTSTDGGATWSPARQAGVFREPHFRTRSAFFRYWGAAFPQLAVGPNQEIYVATTALPDDKPTDDGDIYLMRSLDGGTTWETPARINTDDTSRPQFFPSIGVSPDGVLHAMWGDMRDDPEEVRYHIYYSKSEDEGETWGFELPDQDFTAPDTRVTDFPSNSLRGFPNGLFLGDYFSIAPTEDEVYMVWADTRLGEFGGANQQIGFARQEAISSPELFLNPPSGPAGRDVAIQGFGFQPDSNVFLQVEGVVVANNLRTDDKGEFQTNVYMPITGEGPSDIRAFDETGNVAAASFYTEFGFDNVQKALEAINQQLGIETPVPGATPSAEPADLPEPPDATPESAGAAAPVVSSMGGLPVGGFGIGGMALAACAYAAVHWRRRQHGR